jgi:predicted small lipoprotein YifL
MKKIIALLLVLAMVFAIAACGGNGDDPTTEPPAGTTGPTTGGTVTPPENPGFDEDEVVFTFGAISDIHLEKNSSYGTEAKFANALATLIAFSEDRGNLLDAVAIVGDICEKKEQIETFKSIYEGAGLPGELIFTLGNHDQEYSYSNTALTLQDYKDVLGDDYFSNEHNNMTTGDRYYEINGQHFIVVQPKAYGTTSSGNGVTFHDSTIQWLDAKLAEITSANPNAYVHVLIHAMVENTCYGSNLKYGGLYGGSNGSYWATSQLTPTLEKYPQVITYSGHLHFPINDERSIMQNKFTSIGTGSVAYLAIENGYSNTVSATVPQNAGAVSSGHVVEVDKYGNVRITRLNLATGEFFGEPWVLNAPTADGSHLTKYTQKRSETNEAPKMDATATPRVDVNTIGGNRIGALTFTAGTDDSFVHHYEIKVTNTTDNAVVKEVKWLTDFYLYTDTADMAQTYSVGLGAVVGGKEYKVEVTAVDSWGAKSTTATTTFTVPEGFDGTLPDALVDVEFNADGTATDKMGNATIDLVGGATVASKDVTHNGVNKPMAGLQVTAKGQSGVLTLTNYDLAAMKALYNGAAGFSFEAFYVNRAKSGTQGIICATEFGGLGMADSGSGVPGLCVYANDSKYTYTKGTEVASSTDLVHVITTTIVYDNCIYTSVYVNGQLTDSKATSAVNKSTTEIWMTDSRYAPYANQLGLGNDIGPNGFPTTDFTMVDAKIYNVALNPEQVKTAYNNAKALFN